MTEARSAEAGVRGEPAAEVDVLIVGAGPTGLTLAAQLETFGTSFRIIDRLLDRAGESRALAIQARSIEIFQSLGLGEEIVAAGRTSTRLVLHFGDRSAEVELGFRAPDSRYPFILFLSQAETERILNEHLTARGVQVERGVELVQFSASEWAVDCTVRDGNGREQPVRARYLAGCDGAHSTVRTGAGIPFEGGTYLQDFGLGDLEANGPLQPGAVNAFAGGAGVALFFPLGSPSTWRVIAMAPGGNDSPSEGPMTSSLSLSELQEIVDNATDGTVRLRDPEWLTHFRLHHRQTAQYRAGRIFLAGDASHIHSPVGAQGMNTGIQDAWNLGWKLAFVVHGWADEALLDSYHAERWPVGRALLRTTDRIFSILIRSLSASAAVAWFRRQVVSRIIPRILRSQRFRSFAFGFVSELRIGYPKSPAVREGEPGLEGGPKAGERLPDGLIARNDQPTYLQQALVGPRLHLLLCGDPRSWDSTDLSDLEARYDPFLTTTKLARRGDAPGILVDETGDTLSRLAVDGSAQYLVRPDGHIAFRCAGVGLVGVREYLERWFEGSPPAA